MVKFGRGLSKQETAKRLSLALIALKKIAALPHTPDVTASSCLCAKCIAEDALALLAIEAVHGFGGGHG
jgi:hypothetical protein